MRAAQQAGVTFGGVPLEVVTSFKYLGIVFSSTHCLAGSAAPARAKLAHLAMHNCRARCAELGVAAAPVRLQLFSTMVDSVLSYGAEVWAPQLAARAASRPDGNSGSAAERLHLSFLRRELGVRQATPNVVVLTELGERPLWLQWLRRAARLWNKLLAQPADSLTRRALDASIALAQSAPGGQLARQSWAGQLAAALGAIGMPLDLQQPATIGRKKLESAGLEHHLAQLEKAATREGASRLQYYVQRVHGGDVGGPEEYGRAPYLDVVRERARREALAQLRTGSHWGAEETGRWERIPREQRICPHCVDGVEDVAHMLFDCPLYAPLRAQYSELFSQDHTIQSFLGQPAGPVAHFAAACRRTWVAASRASPHPH